MYVNVDEAHIIIHNSKHVFSFPIINFPYCKFFCHIDISINVSPSSSNSFPTDSIRLSNNSTIIR